MACICGNASSSIYGIIAFNDVVTKITPYKVEGFVQYMKVKWERSNGVKGAVQQVPEERA